MLAQCIYGSVVSLTGVVRGNANLEPAEGLEIN